MLSFEHVRHYGLGQANLTQCWPQQNFRPNLEVLENAVLLWVPKNCYDHAKQRLGWWRPFESFTAKIGQALTYRLSLECDKQCREWARAQEAASPKLNSWILSVSVSQFGGLVEPDRALQIVHGFQQYQTVQATTWREQKDGGCALEIGLYFEGMNGPDRDLTIRFNRIDFGKT